MILICPSCSRQQFGIVQLHWSEGAVVYSCKHCGAFNEVDEVAKRHRLRVTTQVQGTRRNYATVSPPPRIAP